MATRATVTRSADAAGDMAAGGSPRASAVVDTAGGTPTWTVDKETAGIENGGVIIHELGTVRMGNDPGKSAVNRYCQAHEARNVFVTDGGPFVSQADKNPTWTILALSMRTSEYIAEQMKANAL